ncbi:MAG: tRNA (adenosine(37)-N6)-threonylcarbamoyltransferase complex ATPase subunit type 1 TsaE [Candidatus Omnitrophica bacterium]|nr:tRNA (adenosine(37)-N6)-threonylcarbamoyltransferase complex ATPase subunit type 1 TsaE [Candidatus Omnitrophota bacterium]MDD5553371.1 tRNA (adenosine(37)-N6)-threonylcarbamoyltransferase complex ATPase subunit type 1 TsaE [Candidatus Omnitrophota bacterium]
MISRSVNETIRIGRIIGKNLKKGDIICLSGELGSGKTVLAKGIALGLGVKKTDVISPSFVLIRRHFEGRLPLYHFDLYRLNGPAQIIPLGFEEYFYGDGVTVIEWAEKLRFLLPVESLKADLSFKTGTQRVIKFTARGARYRQLLKRINENLRN